MLWFIEEKNLIQQELQSTEPGEEKHQTSVPAGGHWNGKQLHEKRTWGFWWTANWIWASNDRMANTFPGLHYKVSCLKVREGNPSFLFNTGEATPEVLCPILGSPVQERNGHTEECSMKGYEDDKGTGASLLWGKTDRDENLQPREEKVHQTILTMYINIWRQVAEDEARLF